MRTLYGIIFKFQCFFNSIGRFNVVLFVLIDLFESPFLLILDAQLEIDALICSISNSIYLKLRLFSLNFCFHFPVFEKIFSSQAPFSSDWISFFLKISGCPEHLCSGFISLKKNLKNNFSRNGFLARTLAGFYVLQQKKEWNKFGL